MIYIYYCKNSKCKNTIEVVHSMKESPNITCPICEEKMKVKVTGGCGFVFPLTRGSNKKE
jgi:putative FmdB family regulatory protein